MASLTNPLRPSSTNCVSVDSPSVSISSRVPPGINMMFSPRLMAFSKTRRDASRQPQQRENSRTPGR
eukprot:2930528-Prymnesium_polylepis.1